MPDREKYIEVLSKTAKTVKEFNEDTPIKISLECVEDILALLKEQEAVVRCKDCKHSGCRTQNVDGSIFRVVCKKHSTKRNERWMDADWFCADGERK